VFRPPAWLERQDRRSRDSGEGHPSSPMRTPERIL